MKALALSASALVLLAAPALAADLPVVVEPVDYVRICDAYGEGFLFIPGTDTCLRVAGRGRADYNLYFAPEGSSEVFDNRGYDDTDDQGYRFRARANFYVDTVTSTEFGLLRTYLDVEVTRDSNSRGGGETETDVSLENAFIEYGGLTFGRRQSFYDYLDAQFSDGQTFDPALSDTEINLAAYTAKFGDFSATLSLEDTTERRYAIAEGRYGGAQVPDVVGVLNWEKDDVGSAQLMAAGHFINAEGFADPEGGLGRVTDETYGFAVGAGFAINLPFGNDTEIGATASYARGALNYLSTDISSPVDVYDAAFGSAARASINGDLELSEGVSVSGGIGTNFTDTVRLGLTGGWLYVDGADTNIDYDGDGTRDSLKVQNIDAQAYLTYEPVSDFELALGAEYRYVDADELGDTDLLTTFFRAQRQF